MNTTCIFRALVLMAASWLGIAAAQTPSVVDPAFNPGLGANNDVFAVTLQPDGKILVGGQFDLWNGMVRGRLARLNADGSLDSVFNAGSSGANGDVYAIALQPDGKILVGGAFTAFHGEPAGYLARLHSNGALDTSFHAVANNELRGIALQPDGKIVIGGRFTMVGGTLRNRVARLNADGTLDPSFDPGEGANDSIRVLLRQPDGKILIGGQFTGVNETNRFHLARLNVNGGLDDGFNPPLLNGVVRSLAQQPDGKVLAVGEFNSANGVLSGPVLRLLAEGTRDPAFTPPPFNGVALRTVVLQPDSKILVGGDFTSVDGTFRNRIARLLPQGGLDAGWNPGAGADDEVFAVSVQSDGMILAGGQFATIDYVGRAHIARLFGDTRVNLFDFSMGIYSTSEFGGNASISIRRTGATGTTQSVDLVAEGGTATAGTDYEGTTFRVTFLPGQSEQTVAAMRALEDALVESMETVNLHLRNPTPGVGFGVRSNAVLRIEDGTSFIQFTDSAYNTMEGQYGFPVTYVEPILVRLGSLGPATVTYRTSSGTASAEVDFIMYTNTVYFSAGQQQAYAVVPILNDGIVEPTEHFTIFLDQFVGGRPGPSTNATVNILDNDAPLQFLAPTFDGSEQAGGVIAVVQRGDDGPGVETVQYSTSPGTARSGVDYLAQSGTLIFQPGEMRKTVVIPVVSDCVAEPSEFLTLTLSNPSGGAVLGANSTATLRLTDNAAPGSPDATFHAPTNVNPPFVVQADGRIVAIAEKMIMDGVWRSGPVRLFLDGAPDPSFDARLFFGPGGDRLNVTALASQPDGKLLVGAWRLDTEGFAFHYLLRLRGDGSQDTNFTGIYELGAARTEIRTIAVQPDGRILVGGMYTFHQGTVPKGLRRLTADGLPDVAFDDNLGLGLFGSNGVFSVALQSDGRILAGGDFFFVDQVNQSGLTRLNRDGTRDTNFNTGQGVLGTVNSVIVSSMTATSIITIPLRSGGAGQDVSALNAGMHQGIIHLDYNMYTVPDTIHIYYGTELVYDSGLISDFGQIDVPFGPGPGTEIIIKVNEGLVGFGTVWDYTGHIRSETLQEKPVIGGNFLFVDTFFRRGVARLNPDGFVDSTFDADTQGDFIVVEALVPQPAGGVLLGGSFSSIHGVARSGLARLRSNGALDTNYVADPNLFVSQLGLQPDGSVMVGGLVAPEGTNYALVRFRGDPVVRFNAIARSSLGSTQLILNGPAGDTYRVQSSPDLRTWTSLGTITFSGCLETFTDSSAARSNFYRAVQVSPPGL